MAMANRIRLDIHLRKEKVPAFFSGARIIHDKQAANAGVLGGLPIDPALLLQQITDGEAVHQQTKTVRGLIGTRTTKVNLIWTSLSTNLHHCQILCDNSPGQALVLAEASGYHISLVGTHVRPLIAFKVEIGRGIAHLQANVAQLPAPSGKTSVSRNYLWRYTPNGGQTIVNAESSPTARTTIMGLPLNTEVGFSVAVKDATGTGPWSIWIPAFIR